MKMNEMFELSVEEMEKVAGGVRSLDPRKRRKIRPDDIVDTEG